MDPQTNADGSPYGPVRYEEIVRECYLISKNINTSYVDVLKITPVERNMILNFLLEEAKRREEILAKQEAEREANKQKPRRRY